MPRVRELAVEFGVAPNTMLSALKRLDAEGYFRQEGRYRVPPKVSLVGREPGASMRIGFLVPDERTSSLAGVRQVVLQLRLKLEAMGCRVVTWHRGGDVFDEEISSGLIREMEAAGNDAWVVVNGTGPLLKAAAESSVPMLALAGRSLGIPMAVSGMTVNEPLRGLVRELAGLGHRRIVMVCSRLARLPEPGLLVRVFREELRRHGLDAGEFNVPDWDPTPEGLRRLFDSLFRLTPPTAVILFNDELAVAMMHYAASTGLRVPRDLTVVALEGPGVLRWCHPPVAHFREDIDGQVEAVIRWVEGVRRGQPDREARPIAGVLERGGTIAPPAPRRDRGDQSRV